MRRGATIGIISGMSVAMLAAGGYGAYSLVAGSDDSGGESGKPKARTVLAEPPTPEQATAGAKAFLDAWAAGDISKAAALTDDPGAATTALTAFRDKVRPTALALTPGGPATPAAYASATGNPSAKPSAKPSASADPSAAASASPTAGPTGLLMGFKAKAEFEGTNKTWDYDGFLGVLKMSDNTTAVRWDPSVIHPKLGQGETISTEKIFSAPTGLVDRNNARITSATFTPAMFTRLQATVQSLAKDDPNADPNTVGSGVVITGPKNETETIYKIIEPKQSKPLKLTIDNALQAAAEKAVADFKGKPGSIVAIEPSTGHVLAFANSAGEFNRAFDGKSAPGSTMKIVSATALLEAGVTPDTVVPCPAKSTNPRAIPNSFTDVYPTNTLKQDFMISCNTAFIEQARTSLKPSTLGSTAKEVYGIGLEWKTGLSNADGSVPDPGSNKDEWAMQMIGQGKVQMNPLAIASITATVKSGEFKQPILIAGLPQPKAPRTLSAEVASGLRSMMAATAKEGTAKGAMASVSGDVGAKTGSAEATGIETSNSWFTAYRGNLAVAAEVEGGGHGADAAGPAVASVLMAGR
ncbi:penicillin-binding transpeptidase domain-containing protein [Kitasatospora sp. NPDC054939]